MATKLSPKPKKPQKPSVKRKGIFESVEEGLYQYTTSKTFYSNLKVRGKLIRKSLKTTDKATARRKLADLRADKHNVDHKLARLTVGQLLERFLKTREKFDNATIEKARCIGHVFEKTWPGTMDQKAEDVKSSDVLDWIGKQRARKLKKSSLNEYVFWVKKLFSLALADRVIPRSPADHPEIKAVKRDKPHRPTPTWEEYAKIIKNVRAQGAYNPEVLESADFLEFMGLSGLGLSELANLKWGDIDLKAGIMRPYRNKTDTSYNVPIFPQLRPILERLKKKCPAENRYPKTSTPLPEASIFGIKNPRKALTKACQRLRLPRYTTRSFRRLFVSRSLNLNIPPKVVASWQGHADSGYLIASVYSHLAPDVGMKYAKRLVKGSTSGARSRSKIVRVR